MIRKPFKKLTKEDKQYLAQIYYDENINHKEKMEILTKKFGIGERTVRRWWKEELNLSELRSKLPLELIVASKRDIDRDTKMLLVSSAQNKTGVFTEALNNMIAYAEHWTAKGIKTQILIAPTKYRNPTSLAESMFSTNEAVENWWRDEVKEYLYYGKIQFGDTIISSDSRVVPTAKNPLNGFEPMAKDHHLILPHSKIHWMTLPRFKKKPLRTMCTTGFITHKNYSESKAGDLGSIHHSYGFVVLEKKKDGTCHIPRNVKITSGGSFTDLVYEVKKGKVDTITSTKGLVWGDIHSAVVDHKVINKTISLCKHLNPESQVLHDVYDGSTVNPHEQKDMFIQRQKIMQGNHLIDKEIEETFSLIEHIKDSVGAKTYISISNHDVFLDRFINDENWKRDLHNSPTYLKYAYIQQTEDLTKYGGLFGYLVYERFKKDVTYINYGESLEIEGIETGSHGDFGVNGARGNFKSFARLNTKMIHGHSHSPVIFNGVTVVGVSCLLNQYYTRRGLSSWAHAHSVIHDNGKRQLLCFGDDYELTNLIKF